MWGFVYRGLTRDFNDWMSALVVVGFGDGVAVVALTDLLLVVDLDVCVTCAERVCIQVYISEIDAINTK